ncbi:MAG: extracellular solute-binding protein, partial [Chloroflexi bacterium]|nr:extracellular solute-binding protein [Chloroflexota bacterium]
MRDPSLAVPGRRFAACLVAVMMLATACGSGVAPSGSAAAPSATSAGPSSQTSPSQPGAGVTITVGLISSPTNDAIQKLIPDFTAQTGIKVNVISQDWATGHQKYLLAFKAKQGLYDVAQFDDPYLPAFAAGKFLQPLDELIKKSTAYDSSDIPQNILDYGKIEGVT